MKMEKKQCTKCKHFLSFECFRINKQTAQLTKRCFKCLDICKRSRQQSKCKHGRLRSYCLFCGGSQVCEHNKIKSYCFFVAEVKFVSTTGKDQNAFPVAGVEFLSTTDKDQNAFSVAGVEFVRTTGEDQYTTVVAGVRFVSNWTPCRGRTGSCLYCLEKRLKKMSSTECLGCNIETFKKHIEQQFLEGMS